MNLEEI